MDDLRRITDDWNEGAVLAIHPSREVLGGRAEDERGRWRKRLEAHFHISHLDANVFCWSVSDDMWCEHDGIRW